MADERVIQRSSGRLDALWRAAVGAVLERGGEGGQQVPHGVTHGRRGIVQAMAQAQAGTSQIEPVEADHEQMAVILGQHVVMARQLQQAIGHAPAETAFFLVQGQVADVAQVMADGADQAAAPDGAPRPGIRRKPITTALNPTITAMARLAKLSKEKSMPLPGMVSRILKMVKARQ